jgi:hypothetical protein
MAADTAAEAEQRVTDIASSLIAVLDTEDARIAELQEQLRDADNRRARIKMAIDALKKKEAAAQRGRPRKGSPSDGKAYPPTQPGVMEAIMRTIDEYDGSPFTVREIVDRSGQMESRVRRGIEHLRQEQHLRRAGVRNGPGGNANLYATMPVAVG